MKVSDLKALLESCDDDADVVVHISMSSYRKASARVTNVLSTDGWHYPIGDDVTDPLPQAVFIRGER